jgi:hypothetical protein
MKSITEAVPLLFKAYGKNPNPAALIKALEGLVQTHVELRDVRAAKEIAASVCRKLHPEPSDKLACGGCFDAAIERINSDGQ